MSLITDALGLRQKKSGGVRPAKNLPPLPASRKTPAIFLLATGVCLLALAGFWKGQEALIWLENLAGIPSREIPREAAPPPAVSPNEVPVASPASEPTSPPPPSPVVAGPGQVNLLHSSSGSGPQAGPAALGTLQPVVVESVEKVKNMDPKFIEQERRNRVENFLAGLRVQGVRIQGSESRIMVDGALISLGEPIGDFGLRLKSVESGRLVFVDSEGREYPKSY